MKKTTSLGVGALVALLAVLAMVGLPTPAQAYPDVQIYLTANPQQLYGGETFTATGSSTNTNCTWRLEWDGQVRESGPTTEFKTVYTADEVSKVTRIPLRGTCTYQPPNTRGLEVARRTVMIKVLPRASAVSPPGVTDLPGTGGPTRLFLAGGVVLLLAGATAVTVARRRAEEAEIQASRA